MKVIATKQGYFGKLRDVGDEFEVPEGSKASWFQPVEQSLGAAQKLIQSIHKGKLSSDRNG